VATKKASAKKAATIRIQWVQSAIGSPDKHKQVVRGLGLRKLQQVVERPDTPSIRGMVAKVPHLVRIVD
jgi:large subunit ribosomal protein L30